MPPPEPSRRDDPDRRAGTPAGIERARRRPDAPPRGLLDTGRREIEEPPLPDDPPQPPRGVGRRLEQGLRSGVPPARARSHLGAAMAWLAADDHGRALPHLRWLARVAPRDARVRELLASTAHRTGRMEETASEAAAFRRLAGSAALNHLAADAAHRLDRGAGRIPELVEEMDRSDVDRARAVLGRLVWVRWLSDRGEVGAARAVLQGALDDPPADRSVVLRTWYAAGELAERSGEADAARSWFARVDAAAPGPTDAGERAGGRATDLASPEHGQASES